MFSVIIPIFNKFPHLDRSVDSVLHQDFKDFELILVDDGSTDGSYEKALSFKDDRIKVFQRDSPGPGGYAARNFGIQKAKYDWVAFLDADDEWQEHHLSTLSGLLAFQPNAQILSTCWLDNFDSEDRQRTFPNAYCKENQARGIHEIGILTFLKSSSKGAPPFWTGALAIKTTLLRSIKGFPEGRCKRGGDVDTWLRAMYFGKLAVWSPLQTVTYHRDSMNMVTKQEKFELGCEAETVKILAKKANNSELEAHLHVFLNARIVSRWLQTLRVGQRPGSLLGKVSWKYLDLKGKILALTSMLPNDFVSQVYRRLKKGKYD
ncbi:MAG: glycosyltransferase family A protein [Cyclobacterium sp.]|uniref:glycosyltransferase family A protein n=1 Tax=Cyclobacterium sp. TaxID=1966343 RepID=UPI003970B012